MKPGDVFGCITVISDPFKPVVRGKVQHLHVRVRCTCGNEYACSQRLVRGERKFCVNCRAQVRHAQKLERLTAELQSTYGAWTVIGEPVFVDGPRGARRPEIPVRCECGVERQVQWNQLKGGLTSFCGKCGSRRSTGNVRGPYHLLTVHNEETRQATCRLCGPTHAVLAGTRPNGRPNFRCGERSLELNKEHFDRFRNKHQKQAWHVLEDIDTAAMVGTCLQCGQVPVRFTQNGSECYYVCASHAKRKADNEGVRGWRLRKYGLTLEDYDRILELQGGRCAICGTTRNARADSDGRLVVDHCHATGEVRGLLCSTCNSGLGHFADRPAVLMRAAEYLKAHQAVGA